MDTVEPADSTNLYSPGQIKRRKLEEEHEQQQQQQQNVDSLIEIEDEEEDQEMVLDDDDMEESTLSNNNHNDSSKRYIQSDGQPQTFGDVIKSISSERLSRKDYMSSAVIDPLNNRIRFTCVSNNSKMNPKFAYGYDVNGKSYLCPEEALYLVEIGKLEICIEKIPISIMKARALLISEKFGLAVPLPSPSQFDGTTCTDEEYTVFKFLTSYGYRVRRCYIPHLHSSNRKDNKIVDLIELEDGDEDVEMRMGSATNDTAQVIQDNTPVPTPMTCTTSISSSTTTILDGDEDLGAVGPLPSSSKPMFEVRGDEDSFSSIEEDDEPMPSTSKGPREPYTVVEVDSDVEFIDEVIFTDNNVVIEEVGSFNYEGDDGDVSLTELPDIEEDDDIQSDGGGYYEEDEEEELYGDDDQIIGLGTSTSMSKKNRRRNNGGGDVLELVDLVSSEDEDTNENEMKSEIIQEDVAVKNFAETIWSKFVPNSVVHLEFPPASLLPKEVQRNFISNNTNHKNVEGETTTTTTATTTKEGTAATMPSSSSSFPGSEIPKTYEFDMKDQGDQSDLELEKIVDELKIDSEPMDESTSLKDPDANLNSDSVKTNKINTNNIPPVKNWKEWRQQFVKEAHDVFDSSLLGSGDSKANTKSRNNVAGNGFAEKLNLWANSSTKSNGNSSSNQVSNVTESLQDDEESDFTYYVYLPTDKRINKAKLDSVKPAFRVFISRNVDVVRDVKGLKGKRNDDNIPILIALVQEDSGVTFLQPDLTPIPSLNLITY